MARKMCTGCGVVKPLADFTKSQLGYLGRHSKCRACGLARAKRPKPAGLPLGDLPKRCAGCEKTKPLSEFYSSKYAKDGRTSRCKPCFKAQRQPGRQEERRRIAVAKGKRYQTARERYRNLSRGAPKTKYIKNKLLRRIRKALRNQHASPSLELLLGYSLADLRRHIERQFVGRMGWERFFAGEIHIDHIVPAVDFDLGDRDGIRACFALTNLQPLWGPDNVSKGTERRYLV